jgi:hypothetical protein
VSEHTFEGLLMTIIDTHREAAERNRRAWRRAALAFVLGVLAVGIARAETFPVMFSWSYPQPVPAHVIFELFVRPCATCNFEAIERTRSLAVSQSHDYTQLQPDSFVVVRDQRSGQELERLSAVQGRIDARLLPALRACRMGNPCPGAGAMQRMLRTDGERDREGRANPRIIP